MGTGTGMWTMDRVLGLFGVCAATCGLGDGGCCGGGLEGLGGLVVLVLTTTLPNVDVWVVVF